MGHCQAGHAYRNTQCPLFLDESLHNGYSCCHHNCLGYFESIQTFQSYGRSQKQLQDELHMSLVFLLTYGQLTSYLWPRKANLGGRMSKDYQILSFLLNVLVEARLFLQLLFFTTSLLGLRQIQHIQCLHAFEYLSQRDDKLLIRGIYLLDWLRPNLMPSYVEYGQKLKQFPIFLQQYMRPSHTLGKYSTSLRICAQSLLHLQYLQFIKNISYWCIFW